jgi:hypothetical protein
MRRRSMSVTLAAFLGAVVVCLAQAADPNMGTWKLNEAKSKLSPGTAKNTTVIYAVAGDKVKVTVDGIDPDGKPVHSEWTGMFDGKDYPVTGDPLSDTRSYKRVNDHTLAMVGKKDGKAVLTVNIAVASDGKTRTVTSNGTDAKGKKYTSVAVYDKQ